MKIKDLNVGDTIQIPNGKLPLEGKVKSVSGDIAHIEIPMVGHRFISDETDFIRIRKARKPLDPTKWLEKAVKENSKKTKSVLESGLGISKPATEYNQSNDIQQRKRKEGNVALFKIEDLKVGYKVQILKDDMIGEVSEIADNGKSAEIRVDDGVYRIINDNYDFTIIEWNSVPEYPDDTVNHPSHYNYGDIETIDYCDQVCKQYPPELAPYVFNAIKYLSRANHKNGREDIDKAKFYVQRLFDKWDVK